MPRKYRHGDYVFVSVDGDKKPAIITDIYDYATDGKDYRVEFSYWNGEDFRYAESDLERRPKFQVGDRVKYHRDRYGVKTITSVRYNDTSNEFSYAIDGSGAHYYETAYDLIERKKEMITTYVSRENGEGEQCSSIYQGDHGRIWSTNDARDILTKLIEDGDIVVAGVYIISQPYPVENFNIMYRLKVEEIKTPRLRVL